MKDSYVELTVTELQTGDCANVTERLSKYFESVRGLWKGFEILATNSLITKFWVGTILMVI